MRVAVIGIGRVGYQFSKSRGPTASHTGALLAHPKTEIVAVADIDRTKLEDFKIEHPDVRVYQDYEKMLSEAKPEIVSVATPTETHCRIVRNVARYHPVKVIFCEKPIAATLEEAGQMIRTCEQFGVKLVVNHIRRWDNAYRRVKRIVDGEDETWSIGELLAFEGRFSGDRINDGVHMADLALWMGQEKTQVSLLNVETPYLVFDVDLFGSAGAIRILDNGADVQLRFAEESQIYKGFRELGGVARLEETYDFSQAMLNAVEDLVECATSDKQPECTGSDGLYALGKCLEMEMLEVP